MLKRIIIAIVVLPVLGILVFLKNPFPVLFLALFFLCGAIYEIYLILEKKEVKTFKKTGVFFAALIFLSAIFYNDIFVLYIYTVMILYLFFSVVFSKKINDLPGVFFTSGPVLYVTILGIYIIKLRLLPDGIYFLFLLPLLTWIYDAGAYFTGRFFGKHKLIPELSPGKTVEGLFGGILINIITIVIIKFTVLPNYLNFKITDAIILPLLTSCFGQVGDIAASVIKRYGGVKNSSNLFSEHGGILDKMDSMLFNAPVIYLYVKYIILR